MLYKLIRYAADEEEETIDQGEDQQKLVDTALGRANDPCTYRIEAREKGVCIGRMRVFQNGKELTNDIQRSVGIVNLAE